MMTEIFSISLALFFLMDPVGNIPFYIAFLKGIPPKRQPLIIFREMLFALIIIILFNYLGEALLTFLHVTQYTVKIAGGIILFLLALKMVFPSVEDSKNLEKELSKQLEPFIVPLAVPLVAGPASLAGVLLYTRQVENNLIMLSAIFIAWGISLVILLGAPFIRKVLGDKGIMATERLMGLILTLIAIQMFLSGVAEFISEHKIA